MPVITGGEAIRKTFAAMTSAPGFSLSWTPTKAEVGASGDIGYTAGTYQSTMGGVAEKGKYVTVWKKQADGAWKVTEDIFNADEAPKAPAGTHVLMPATALKWGASPPAFRRRPCPVVRRSEPGAPYVLRAQLGRLSHPAHWHPTIEKHHGAVRGRLRRHGRDVDEKAMQDVPDRRVRIGARGYAPLLHGEDGLDHSGAWNRTSHQYINADDPRLKK